jgi:hypothetical protein
MAFFRVHMKEQNVAKTASMEYTLFSVFFTNKNLAQPAQKRVKKVLLK